MKFLEQSENTNMKTQVIGVAFACIADIYPIQGIRQMNKRMPAQIFSEEMVSFWKNTFKLILKRREQKTVLCLLKF